MGKSPKYGLESKPMRKPDDTMTKMELDEDLRRIGLSKRKDPKLLLAKMLALNIRYGITITNTKKCAMILPAGQKDHAAVVTITSTIITTTKSREVTPQEMIHTMHKQC